MFTCSRLIVVGVLAAVAFAVNKDAAKCDCEVRDMQLLKAIIRW